MRMSKIFKKEAMELAEEIKELMKLGAEDGVFDAFSIAEALYRRGYRKTK